MTNRLLLPRYILRQFKPFIVSCIFVSELAGALSWNVQSKECPKNPMFVSNQDALSKNFPQLNPAHPRLIVNSSEILRIKALLQTDPLMQYWYREVNSSAQQMLQAPQLEVSEQTHRILMRRMITLAALYLIDGDQRKLAKAKADLLHMAEAPTWTVPHELILGEISLAAGLGYDWLYNDLSVSERQKVKNAILRNAAHYPTACSMIGGNNWLQVCYGGVGVATLAAAEPDDLIRSENTVRKILDEIAQRMLDVTLWRYNPDGAWYEGITYWNYALTYSTHLVSALKTSLGDDLGLFTRTPGISRSGEYYSYIVGANGRAWNYWDSWDRQPSVRLMWHAREFGRPDYMKEAMQWYGREYELDNWPAIFFLLEYDPRCVNGPVTFLPRVKAFYGLNPVVFFRSTTNDPTAFSAGIKGGINSGAHSHYDIGSFVMDFRKTRFAEDLGADNYSLPGYFGPERSSIYRIKTEGQNTLTMSRSPIQHFQAPNQAHDARGGILHVAFNDQHSEAVIDMTSAYSYVGIKKALRGLYQDGNEVVHLHDVIESNGSSVYVNWNLHTLASVTVQGNLAELKRDGVLIQAKIIRPEGAVFSQAPANPRILNPNSMEDPNIGVEKLVIALPAFSQSQEILVRFALQE